MKSRLRIALIAALPGMAAFLAPAFARAEGVPLDLGGACLVLPPGMSGPEAKAAQMLVEEVEKRCQVRWLLVDRLPAAGSPAVVLGRRDALIRAFPELAARLQANAEAQRPEGYRILSADKGPVIVAGNDARGVLYGAGRLLRLMSYSGETPPDHLGGATLASGLDIATAPRYPLRGDQLGYRPKTNAYDGWNKAMWEQYVRDLVVFGANAIEGLPPRTDDAPDSPHFTLPPLQMMIEQSRLAQEYGVQYWVWYPAMDADYGDPATVERALREWEGVLGRLPKVDAVFVPGGDPGHTAPKELFAFLEKVAAQLRRLHPGATLWMSPQGFSAAWMNDFYRLLKAEPTWLEGMVFGPQQRESLAELRARVPRRYKMRFYPDITHSLTAQYPVENWDYAYAATENREAINPRPVAESEIFRRWQPLAETGVLTYSEGCNDDVNKCLWNCLAWDPDRDVRDILRDYGHYFIGGDVADGFADGLLALERNWRGPLAGNEGVYATLRQFQDLERRASPAVLENWRFQEGLYRAYYDATDRARLLAETAAEDRAMDRLRQAGKMGSRAALAAALAELAPPAAPPAAEWRARVFELAEALFQSIHMQLSVPRYKAEAVDRGANLDLIDVPLNDAPWLRERFAAIATMKDEAERLRQIDAILHRSDPGPGEFYDNLGDVTRRPHLVLGASYSEDPEFRHSPMIGFSVKRAHPAARISSLRFAETLRGQPLEMLYHGLDRKARYRLRVVYGNETPGEIRLVANGRLELQPMQKKDMMLTPHDYSLPPEATSAGDLRLEWIGPDDRRGAGRGVQVAEVWLLRQP